MDSILLSVQSVQTQVSLFTSIAFDETFVTMHVTATLLHVPVNVVCDESAQQNWKPKLNKST